MTKLPKINEILKRKYLKEFDPREPTDELLDAIKNTRSPKHASLSKGLRDVSLSELPMDTLEYIAYELNFRTTITKFYAKLQYYILMYENLHNIGIDENDFKDAVKEEFDISLKMTDSEIEYEYHMRKSMEHEDD